MKLIKIFMLLVMIISLNSCMYVGAMIMAIPTRKVVEKHKIKNYKIKLVRKQGWAGPAWYGYEVKKRVLGVYMPKKYYWYSRDSIKNCTIFLKDGSLVLDKCTNQVIRKK